MMGQQSILQNELIGSVDTDFHDAHEESSFTDDSNSFKESDQSISTSVFDSNYDEQSTVTFISDHSPDSPSSPSSSGLRHRRLTSPRSCDGFSQYQFFKNNPDGLIDFDPHGSRVSPVKKHGGSLILKDDEKLNENLNSTTVHRSLIDDEDASSAITSDNRGEGINDESITVNSPNSVSDLYCLLAELTIKVISFQTRFLTNSITFPIWLLHSLYLLVTDPFGIIKIGKNYMLGNTSGIWGICYTGLKLIKHLWFQKHASTFKLCFRIAWGLLWFVYCGFILVSLLVPAFLFGGMMMKQIVEEPVRITETLVFDYTKDSPTAFVPIVSCPESSVMVHDEYSKITSLDESRVIPFNHEVHATVSLNLPESNYNLNLGIFQVRLDFLANDGKLLGSLKQPIMLQYKSQPIRLVSTFLNLGSLLTGYTSETQTLDIKFKGFTEKDLHTSCSRILIEQRAEFARKGGVPEIYSASLKIESQPPFFKKILWYSKWLIFMWISMMMYMVELSCLLLCCRPVIFPWVLSSGGSDSSYNINYPGHNRTSGSS